MARNHESVRSIERKNHKQIAHDNDYFRQSEDPEYGTVHLSWCVKNLSEIQQRQLRILVKTYSDFEYNERGWGHHEYGEFSMDGDSYTWHIELMNRDNPAEPPSEPWDHTKVWRILRIKRCYE